MNKNSAWLQAKRVARNVTARLSVLAQAGLTALAVAVCSFPGSAAGATYYVDASRPNDSGNGLSWAAAKATLSAAVTTAPAGSTILVERGTYAPVSTSNKALTIQSVHGPYATIIDGGNSSRCATLGTSASQFGTVLDGFTLRNGRGDYGGGVRGGTVRNCILSGNTATTSGGGAAYSKLTRCTLDGNTAASHGGGLMSGSLTACLVINNKTTSLSGGGAYIDATGQFVIDCVFSNNTAKSLGGGLYINELPDSVQNSSFIYNRSGGNGGGIWAGNMTEVYNCYIAHNSSEIDGGGILDGRIVDCIIEFNTAKNCGGGTYSTWMTRCIVRNNTADSHGGGAYGEGTILNSLFYGNDCAKYGGAIYSDYAYVRNCTITANNAGLQDGGIGGSPNMVANSIVWGNSATSGRQDVYTGGTYAYSCVNHSGTGNSNVAPLFSSDGSYRLTAGSPCLGTGSLNSSHIAAGYDLTIAPRTTTVGGVTTVNRGCYESGTGSGPIVGPGAQPGVPPNERSAFGHDVTPGTGDDIIIPNGEETGSGYISVPEGSNPHHADGTELEGGTAPGGSIIVSPDIIVRPGTGSAPVDNGDGTIHVTPGNTIDIDGDGKPPYVVIIEGDYDPEAGTITTDDVPPHIIYIPDNVIDDRSGNLIVPGHDGQPGTGDDIVIPNGERNDDSGFVTVPDAYSGSGDQVTHADGSSLENGDAPGGSIIVSPDIIVRPGTGNDPIDNGDGTIHVTPGNTIDVDGDGLPPWVVPEDGTYDPETGIFTPDDDSHPSVLVPPGEELEDGNTLVIPGHTASPDDDILVSPADRTTIDGCGYVHVDGDQNAVHRDGSVFDDGGTTIPEGSIIIKPDLIIRPGTGAEKPKVNGDGTIKVVPGNTIDIDGDGLPPYGVVIGGDYDPETGTITTDEVPPRVIHVPDNVIENEDGTITVPGHDGQPDTGDDIVILGGGRNDDSGFVTVPDDSDVEHKDGSELEGGEAPGGSIIAGPDVIVRPGTGDDPIDNGDGTIHVTPGNTIDIDGDGLPPTVVTEEGDYNPKTGDITPSTVAAPVITGIVLDGSTLTLTVSNCLARAKSYTLWGTSDLTQSFAPMTGEVGYPEAPVPADSAAITNGIWIIQGIPMNGNRFFFKAAAE